MKDQVIIIGDLNINCWKNYSNKKELEVLLNMYGLQAVINIPTRIYKETKFATDQIILNPQLWSFKTQLLEITLSDQKKRILNKTKLHTHTHKSNYRGKHLLLKLLTCLRRFWKCLQWHANDSAFRELI
jgi:hypothetical protein